MHRPRPLLVLLGIVAAAVTILVVASLQNTVVYYRTPTELKSAPPSDRQTVRLGGQVMLGSLSREGARSEFRLTDGHTQLLVVADGALPNTFREGQGAVIEGSLRPDGTFLGHDVAVKHSNEYRPPIERAALGAPQ